MVRIIVVRSCSISTCCQLSVPFRNTLRYNRIMLRLIELMRRLDGVFVSHYSRLHRTVVATVNYEVWGVLQERVYRTRIRILKQRLIIEGWSHFDQRIIDRAVHQWRV